MVTSLFSEKSEVHGRLKEWGLREDILRTAVEAGERARRGCTANHPRTAPGLMGWAETIRNLRDTLIPLGWSKKDDGGVPTVVHPTGALAIAVTTGDEGTGVSTGALRSKYTKGSATAAIVETNAVQMEFGDSVIGVAEPYGAAAAITWYLVVRRHGVELRYELSLPAGLGDDGRVDVWKERLIFAPINLDETVVTVEPPPKESNEIIVEVTPKF